MKNKLITVFGLCLFLQMPVAALAASNTVLEFRNMIGVSGVFVGPDVPIRDVQGGGRPWVLDEGRGDLRADGRLEVEVEGLIIPASEGEQFGRNPVPFFLAAVNCLTQESPETGVTVFTKPAETTMIGDPQNGDARIEAQIALPVPCFAPLVFVTSPNGMWFATTGLDSAPTD